MKEKARGKTKKKRRRGEKEKTRVMKEEEKMREKDKRRRETRRGRVIEGTTGKYNAERGRIMTEVKKEGKLGT